MPLIRTFLLVAGVLWLGTPKRVAAQASATVQASVITTTEPDTPYGIERDSLMRRAARVRTRTEARIVSFQASFTSIGGTRRKVASFGRLKSSGDAGLTIRYSQVKVQTSKHKTSGAEVEKICYYGIGKRLLLAEYYEQHRLVRLDLREYPLRAGGEYGTVFRRTQWLSGDYLHLTTYAQENRGKVQHYYYTFPQQPR
jgi:hypothetical protein